ncbi:hypothetical protein GCM10027414_32430 [Humibacter ginsengiterrae]
MDEYLNLRPIDDDEMRHNLSLTRSYTVVLLHTGPRYTEPGARDIIWEHGRRNMQLRDAGILCVVLPIRDDTELAGVGVFTGSVEETQRIIDGDPAVQAGVLVAEVHPAAGFPGAALPA